MGVVRPGLAAAGSRVQSAPDAPGGESPGSAQPRVAEAEAAPRGRCGTRVAPSAAAGATGAALPPPIKLSDPSAAPAVP